MNDLVATMRSKEKNFLSGHEQQWSYERKMHPSQQYVWGRVYTSDTDLQSIVNKFNEITNTEKVIADYFKAVEEGRIPRHEKERS
jgi:hypothetical protein